MNIINKIRQELEENADETIKNSSHKFSKERIELYGVRTPIVRKIGREYFKLIKERPKSEIFDLCEELWQSGYLEESIIACDWSYAIRKNYEPKDFEVFEKWVNTYVTNWASCDTLCNHTIGRFVEMYPEYLSRLKNWAESGKKWLCRAAAVSLIIPARQGKFLNDILEIADILLPDKEDLVQKGYGWMLKVASEFHQKKIFNYVMNRRATMPRTALRYAIEKMPPELRSKAMEKPQINSELKNENELIKSGI